MNKLQERLLFTTSNEYVSPKKIDFHADKKKLPKYIHVDETHLYLQFEYRATLLEK